MKKSINAPLKPLFAFLLLGSLSACKKESSANNIRFSLNGGTPIVCSIDVRPNFDFLGGPNCELQFDRLGGTSNRGSTDIGVFVNNDCDMVTGALPYRTSNFTLATIVYVDSGPPVTYTYPFTGVPNAGSLGNLILTITGRTSNRVQGTITGIIYQSDIGYKDSVTLNCTFDLNMPVK